MHAKYEFCTPFSLSATSTLNFSRTKATCYAQLYRSEPQIYEKISQNSTKSWQILIWFLLFFCTEKNTFECKKQLNGKKASKWQDKDKNTYICFKLIWFDGIDCFSDSKWIWFHYRLLLFCCSMHSNFQLIILNAIISNLFLSFFNSIMYQRPIYKDEKSTQIYLYYNDYSICYAQIMWNDDLQTHDFDWRTIESTHFGVWFCFFPSLSNRKWLCNSWKIMKLELDALLPLCITW